MKMVENKIKDQLGEMSSNIFNIDLYKNNPTSDELKAHLGRGRAKKGMFEGDLVEGELEIGQIAGLIHDIKPVAKIVEDIMAEFEIAKKKVAAL